MFGHFLGIFWAFVPPILMAVGFTYANNADIINVGETELPYAAHVMFSAVLCQTWRQGSRTGRSTPPLDREALLPA